MQILIRKYQGEIQSIPKALIFSKVTGNSRSPRVLKRIINSLNSALGIPFVTGNQHFPSSVSPENWSSRKLTQAHQASETGLNRFNYEATV